MRVVGFVESVWADRRGSFLIADAPVGTTVLALENAVDFDAAGGELQLNGETLKYVGVDFFGNTVTLAAPLTIASYSDYNVDVLPAAWVKYARIITNENDEPITAVVAHSLFWRLQDGVRNDAKEAVAIELDGRRWFVTDVLGAIPTGVTTEELDDEVNAAIEAARARAEQAVLDAEAAMNFAETRVRVFRQDDQPNDPLITYRDGDIWFDTNDGNAMYVYWGGAWVTADNAALGDIAGDISLLQAQAQEALDAAEAAQVYAETKAQTFYLTEAPTGGTYEVGDIWFDTDDSNRMRVWDGTAWIDAGGILPDTQQAIDDAAAAANQAVLDAEAAMQEATRTRTTAQPEPPDNPRKGDIWYDTDDNNAVYVYSSESGLVNELADPSFEGASTDWTAKSGSTIALSTALAHTGTKSLAISGGSWGAFSPYLSVTPGESITVSGFFRTATANDSGPYTGFQLYFYDAGNNQLSIAAPTSTNSSGQHVAAVTSEWRRAWLTTVVPANAVKMKVLAGTPGSTGPSTTKHVDSILVESTNVVNAYYEGNGWTAIGGGDITQAVIDAQNDANAAQAAADASSKVYIQSTAPVGRAQDLWIDTTGGANTPKRWNGTAWVAATDKVATDAAAAVTALGGRVTTAEGNLTALTSRMTDAETDITAVEGRITTAEGTITSTSGTVSNLQGTVSQHTTRLDTAEGNITTVTGRVDNAEMLITSQDTRIDGVEDGITDIVNIKLPGKNKVTYSTSAPGSTPNVVGDIWFQKNANGEIIGQWEGTGGTSWSPKTMSGLVLTNLDAGRITVGTLAAARIGANTIDSTKITTAGLDAAVIKFGTMHGSRIQTGTLSIGQINGLQTSLSDVEQAAVDAEAAAKAHADLVASGAEQSAIDAAAIVAQQKATAAENAAKAYADSQVNGLKTLWGHPINSTFIDGSKIYTGSIQAKSINLGDVTNLATLDPAEPGSVVYNGWSSTSVNGWAGRSNNSANDRFLFRNVAEAGDVLRPGDSMLVSFAAKHDYPEQTHTVQVGVWTTYNGVETFHPADQPNFNIWMGAAGSTYSSQITVSNVGGIDTWTVGFKGVLGTPVYVTGAKVKMRFRGELIVDGTITAQHLSYDSLNGKTIQGALISGSTIQTMPFSTRGVRITEAGLTAYDSSGNPTLTIASTSGAIAMKGSLVSGSSVSGATIQGCTISGGTITGVVLQTSETANRGVKMSSTGLTAYNASGLVTFDINGTSGNVVMTGTINAGSTITGAAITGGTIQTESTANRGLKMSSTGLTGYDGSGAATLSYLASTGAVAMKGDLLSGSNIQGATVTGVLQTSTTANRGIKITNTGMTVYNANNLATLTINGTDGSIQMKGALTSGSSIDGATVTGGVLQTESTASRGVKINSNGFAAYDSNGNPTFTITASTGAVAMKGNLINGSSIDGAVITAASISGTSITGGSISGTTITGTTISGNTITGGSITGTTITGSFISTPMDTYSRAASMVEYGIVVHGGALNSWGQTTDSGSSQFFGEPTASGWASGVRAWGWQPGMYTDMMMYGPGGNTIFRQNGSIGGSVVRAGSFPTGSSLRYKKDVVDMEHSVESLLRLRPVDYTNKMTGERRSGFIAEEAVELGLEDWVAFDEEGRPDAFNYGDWTAALQKIVQTQQAQIEALTKRLEALEA